MAATKKARGRYCILSPGDTDLCIFDGTALHIEVSQEEQLRQIGDQVVPSHPITAGVRSGAITRGVEAKRCSWFAVGISSWMHSVVFCWSVGECVCPLRPLLSQQALEPHLHTDRPNQRRLGHKTQHPTSTVMSGMPLSEDLDFQAGRSISCPTNRCVAMKTPSQASQTQSSTKFVLDSDFVVLGNFGHSPRKHAWGEARKKVRPAPI